MGIGAKEDGGLGMNWVALAHRCIVGTMSHTASFCTPVSVKTSERAERERVWNPAIRLQL